MGVQAAGREHYRKSQVLRSQIFNAGLLQFESNYVAKAQEDTDKHYRMAKMENEEHFLHIHTKACWKQIQTGAEFSFQCL